MLQTESAHGRKSAGAAVQTVDARSATDRKQNGTKTGRPARAGLNAGKTLTARIGGARRNRRRQTELHRREGNRARDRRHGQKNLAAEQRNSMSSIDWRHQKSQQEQKSSLLLRDRDAATARGRKTAGPRTSREDTASRGKRKACRRANPRLGGALSNLARETKPGSA
jgi:hypothetical protein